MGVASQQTVMTVFLRFKQSNMSVIFCDKSGRAVFWVAEDNSRLIDERGKSWGMIEGQYVFDFNGQHRGWYLDGLLRDMNGKVIAFWSDLRSAPSSPVLPFPHLPFPITPISGVTPTKPAFSMTHIMPQLHMDWSELSPQEWLG